MSQVFETPPLSIRPAAGVAARERLVWLDTLRFFAIIGVIVVHVAYAFPALGRAWVLGLGAGRYGVDLFFAISGFLFAELMLGRGMGRWRYLSRRGLRIGAVYYAAMLLYLALRPAPVGRETLLLNLGFLNPWFRPPADYLVEGGWSICAEVFFYTVGVVLLPLLRSRRGVAACWVAAVLVAGALAAFAPGSALADGYSPVLNLPTFLGGVYCWYIRSDAPRRGWASAIVAACFAVVVVMSAAGLPMPPRFVIGIVCTVACWASIRLLDYPALAALGRLSYSVYAFHFAVLEAALVVVVAVLPASAAVWEMALLVFALVVAGAFPVAFVVFRYLETPVSRLLRPGPPKPAAA